MTWLDATAQADLVRRGEVHPSELAEAAIARIEQVNPKLNAVIRTRFDAARLEAAGVLDVISNPMPGEPYYAPPLPRPLVQQVGADPGRLRIGVVDHPGLEGYLDDPQCRASVAGAARLLESLGHHIDQSAPAAMFEQEIPGHFNAIIAADVAATFQAFEMLLGRPI